MLFHVTITVRMPHDVNPEKIKDLGRREHERAADLQRQGKWLHLWRVAGKWQTSASSMSKTRASSTKSWNRFRSTRSWIS
jgi:muconolactone delta-isomerase